jgi:predicted amino acid racemase
MYNPKYPRVIINTSKLATNTRVITSLAAAHGIEVAGVVKVIDGNIDAARAMASSGCTQIASSRMRHLDALRKAGIDKPLLLVRIPMISEAADLVATADVSLVSAIETVRKINEEAAKAGKIFKVILMLEMGDLREGVWGDNNIIEAAREIEDMENVFLLGCGMNIGCYGSIAATPEKLNELIDKAEMIEAVIGRGLDVISGGATSSVLRLVDNKMPERINHLRCGEGIICNRDFKDLYDVEIPGMYNDVLHLRAEVIETQMKPSHPIGEIAFDAFRNRPTYVDRGNRRRAILALGRADVGFPENLIPFENGIEIIGASSDHCLLDIEDLAREIKVGDIIEFGLDYPTTLFVMTSDDVVKEIADANFTAYDR